MASLSASELVVNPDGSIYHLNLKPEHLADWVITVGDPGRVGAVSRHFDALEAQVQKREFVTHIGRLGQKRIMVISTGIGPDNIDIVLNELDALANIDLERRELLPRHRRLNFVRIGTSGSLQEDLPVDAFLFSAFGVGLDNLMAYYSYAPDTEEQALLTGLQAQANATAAPWPIPPYVVRADAALLQGLSRSDRQGITLTAPGFYGPQGRSLRLESAFGADGLLRLAGYRHGGLAITNLEMETSALYGLAKLLGHGALSCNVILAGRKAGQFSADPYAAVDGLIRTVLERIAAF
jgi:uridine phosphorylase